ncbi:hypothetical protein D3C81_1750020 [compost metagenome]
MPAAPTPIWVRPFCAPLAKSVKLAFTLFRGPVIMSVSATMKLSLALLSAMKLSVDQVLADYPLNARDMPLAMAISIRLQYWSSSHLAVPMLSVVGSSPGSQRSTRAIS